MTYSSVMWNLSVYYILSLEPIYDIYVIRNTYLAANLMNASKEWDSKIYKGEGR